MKVSTKSLPTGLIRVDVIDDDGKEIPGFTVKRLSGRSGSWYEGDKCVFMSIDEVKKYALKLYEVGEL